jgi:two-component system NtrC family response regulator
MSNNTILIVEDDPGLQKQLKWALKTDFNVLVAKDARQAEKLFSSNRPAVVLHDLGLPPDERGTEEGKKSIRSILGKSGSVKVIVMTGQGGEQDAVELISMGAHDFFTKPLEIETLKTIIQRAFILSSLEKQDASDSLDDQDGFLLPGVVGESMVMQSVAKVVRKVQQQNSCCLIIILIIRLLI